MSAIVYRLYDTAGALLYIGTTEDMESRLVRHRSTRPDIMSRYARHTVEEHPTRSDAYMAERAAIRAEKPPFNLMSTQPGITAAPLDITTTSGRAAASLRTLMEERSLNVAALSRLCGLPLRRTYRLVYGEQKWFAEDLEAVAGGLCIDLRDLLATEAVAA